MVSSEHRSTHGASRRCGAELRRAPPERRQKLMHLSDAIGAQPNKRLELTPP